MQVLDIFDRTRAAFPGAEVFTSTLDDFTEALQAALPMLSSEMKVVTGEIGDTWAYGIASDADKVAEYRALLRMRTETAWKVEEAAYRNFSRLLLKVIQHWLPLWSLGGRAASCPIMQCLQALAPPHPLYLLISCMLSAPLRPSPDSAHAPLHSIPAPLPPSHHVIPCTIVLLCNPPWPSATHSLAPSTHPPAPCSPAFRALTDALPLREGCSPASSLML